LPERKFHQARCFIQFFTRCRINRKPSIPKCPDNKVEGEPKFIGGKEFFGSLMV